MGPPVTGCIARVEPTAYHQQFVNTVEPDWAMLKLHHAGRLVDDSYTADEWASGDTKIITTSTIHDERLDALPWSEERDIIQSFSPQYHIPADVSVYKRQPLDDRVDYIENHLTGAKFIQSELQEFRTEVIPLFKGFTQGERELCLRGAELLGADMVAIYVTEYFSAKRGNNWGRLRRALDRYTKHDMPNAIVVGLLSPNYLEEVPEYVVAASGQNQWLNRYSPDEQSVTAQRGAFQELQMAVDDALDIADRSGGKDNIEANNPQPAGPVEYEGD